jgi:DNA polymerase
MGSDFSAIQAVVLAALAGEEWRLDVFRTHGKIYEMSAAKLSGIPFEEICNYVDPATGKKAKHPMRQTHGKVGELASGFAGWIPAWKRFGADEFMSSDEEIKQAILAWRRESPMVVEYWGGQTRDRFDRHRERPELYGLEGAAISAVMNPGTCYRYRQCAYQMHEDALYYCGPSGTFMTYHTPRLRPSTREWARPWEQELTYMGWDSQAGWSEQRLYGGVLAQNSDSHESREIQAEKLVRLEDAGYDPVMHTHDEDVCEVPDGYGSLTEYLALTRIMPEWARTPDGRPWPIKVPDAWSGYRFGKWELTGDEPGYTVAA